jgi:hypothetical protein
MMRATCRPDRTPAQAAPGCSNPLWAASLPRPQNARSSARGSAYAAPKCDRGCRSPSRRSRRSPTFRAAAAETSDRIETLGLEHSVATVAQHGAESQANCGYGKNLRSIHDHLHIGFASLAALALLWNDVAGDIFSGRPKGSAHVSAAKFHRAPPDSVIHVTDASPSWSRIEKSHRQRRQQQASRP